MPVQTLRMNNEAGARASRPHRGWHARGYLPHFDAGAVVQTITFRLADSLPGNLPDTSALRTAERVHIIEKRIDLGLGACLLRDPAIARIVRDALRHFDGERYRLLAWVVMPNHVHAMIEQITGHGLSAVVHSWKSFTSHRIGRQRTQGGRLWANDYFDRFIRNGDHYAIAKFYIENNPVKARLAERQEDWLFSSASQEGGRDARAPA